MNDTARHRTAFLLLIAGIALSPLPFGGATAWFDSAFVSGMGAILALWCVGECAARRPAAPAAEKAIRLAAMLYAGVFAWGAFQAWMPVPFGVAHPVWRDATALLGGVSGPFLSVNPEASVRGLLRLGGYACVFFLCYRLGSDERRARTVLVAVTAAATLSAAYGIVSWIAGSGTVLWYERTFEAGNLSATFPNRNAFADYAALGLICALALIRLRAGRPDAAGPGGWLWSVAIFLKYVIGRSWLLLYAALALFAALLLTHSRAGIGAAILACIVFFACAARGTASGRTTVLGALLVVPVAGFLMWAAGAGMTERLAKLPDASVERLTIYRLTAGLIAERPLLGTGLGTFADVFPAVRTPDIRPRIDFAHNSYLENALEMGIPAALAFYLSLGLVAGIFVRAQIRRTAAQPWPAVGIAATVLVASHALFDYAVQFPAVALTLAAILGTATARCATR
ncbi:MAG: O-antigen ligase family protein [Rhodospirillaceae bacterium]